MRTVNFSWTFTSGDNGPSDATAWQQDWNAKTYPYPLYVSASGDDGTNHYYVENRGYSGLVVGGDNDRGTSTQLDDLHSTNSSWGNFQTPHNDYELPNVVAPDDGQYVAGAWTNATSGATPMVASVAMIAAARDPATFDGWPEMKRAVVIATATWRMDLPILTNLGNSLPDQHAGAGLVDAYKAAILGFSGYYKAPGGSPSSYGRYAKTVTFSTDFDAQSRSYDRYYMSGSCDANSRIRVAIAWDATATCDSSGLNCSSSTLDADLDLVVTNQKTGGTACRSDSWDSSWEMCDFPVTDCSAAYMAEIDKYTTNATGTYLGIAWYSYQVNN